MGRVMRPRIATGLSAFKPYFQMYYQHIPRISARHSIFNDFATTVRPLPCVVHLFLRLSFFLPVFMVNCPVSDDVAELVADIILSSLPSYFPDFPAHLPPQMTRYVTTHGGSR